jgi:NAD(P)-dependent dehydrogenase (short-subunit alcohol dehydrogenase family)
MNLHLTDKHILITGGSKGIGLACAMEFLEEGARVSLVSRSDVNLAAGLQTLLARYPGATARIRTFAADLADPFAAVATLDKAAAAFSPVDVLVNSAGAAKRTPATELTPQAWHDAMPAKGRRPAALPIRARSQMPLCFSLKARASYATGDILTIDGALRPTG